MEKGTEEIKSWWKNSALPVFVLRRPTVSGRTSLLGPELHPHRPRANRQGKGISTEQQDRVVHQNLKDFNKASDN